MYKKCKKTLGEHKAMNANFLGNTMLYALDRESTAEAIELFAFGNANKKERTDSNFYSVQRAHGFEAVSITPNKMLYARTFGEAPDKAIVLGKILAADFLPDFEELLPIFRKYGPGASRSKSKAGNKKP